MLPSVAETRSALERDPSRPEAWMDFLEALVADGQGGSALELLRHLRDRGLQGSRIDALSARVTNMSSGGTPFALALECQMAGRLEEAAGHYRRGLAAEPARAEAQYGLGLCLAGMGQDREAEVALQQAVSLNPNIEEAWLELGLCLRRLGGKGAGDCWQRALVINPRSTVAMNNLGNLLLGQNNVAAAADLFQRALSVNPDMVEAHDNLGVTLRLSGRLDEAIACHRRALEIAADYCNARVNLCEALLNQGELEEGDNLLRELLRGDPSPDARYIFVHRAMMKHPVADEPVFHDAMVRALTEPWYRPRDLVASASTLAIKLPGVTEMMMRASFAWPRRIRASELFGAAGGRSPGLASLSDPLVLAMLTSTPICDIRLERLLTTLRTVMLDQVRTEEAVGEDLDVICALAQQCFINEYIFEVTADEVSALDELRDRLSQSQAEGDRAEMTLLAIIACYAPLNHLAERLVPAERWAGTPLEAVIRQQVVEPLAEARIRDTIPRLTQVRDSMSLAVGRQYEENPYPRWVRTAPPVLSLGFDTYVANTLPMARFRPIAGPEGVNVLVAGCGTGQHPIDHALVYGNARILALDISMSSLSYAQRKTAEMGLVDTITYAQADILEIGKLEKCFDVVEASGVLHHLADPMAGWRGLAGLVRPGGMMSIGLYSATGRTALTAAREVIKNRGYTPTIADIRRFRSDMEVLCAPDVVEAVAAYGDFYATSACRDLLFHVQEHVTTIPEIRSRITELGMTFLGFAVPNSVLADYRRRFPDDHTASDLGAWEIYEREHPDTFGSMYQFWLQRD